jgi:transposase
LLEGEFEVLVVNAHHIKAVPGRKTDVKDAQWIADLLQHGLLKASFIPDAPQRALRELTRYRASLVQERTRLANRVQKVLEEANVKLASVATDVLGVSGRAILEAFVGGETDPATLADLAKGRLRLKRPELERALAGRLKPHQAFLLAELLAHLDFLDESLARLSEAIEARLGPFEEALERLDTVPGVNQRIAQDLLAEIGSDMSQFPSAKHLASWAGRRARGACG